MFTGLVTQTGIVRAVWQAGGGATIEVEAPLGGELRPGDSVAVSGVCLTVVCAGAGHFCCDVVGETLSSSRLGSLAAGDRVNLELPLRPSDRLGGHFVQGHVDGIGTVNGVEDEGSSRRVAVGADPDLCRYVVDKGSVTVDGVSLTAVDATPAGFSVALVPETRGRTTLGALTAGDRVNLEVDVLAKYVESLLTPAAPPEPAETRT